MDKILEPLKQIIYDYSRRLEKQELEFYQLKMMLLEKGVVTKVDIDEYFSDEAISELKKSVDELLELMEE